MKLFIVSFLYLAALAFPYIKQEDKREEKSQQETMEQAIKLFPVELNGKWGYIDENGNVAIKPQFDKAEDFSEGLALIKINNKFGYVDKTGKIVIALQVEEAYSFSEGLARVATGGLPKNLKYGYINKKGETFIEPKFFLASDFSEELASVMFGHWGSGYIDKTGNIAIKPRFNYAGDFSEGLAPVVIFDGKSEKCGYINKTGNIAIALQFDFVKVFSNGLAPVKLGTKFGYINMAGTIVIKPQFYWAEKFSKGGLARVWVADTLLQQIIDKSGKIVHNPKLEDVYDFPQEVAMVTIGNNKKGYFDKSKGSIVFFKSLEYNFSEGLAKIIIDGAYGYVDTAGKIVILPQFIYAENFSKGQASVFTLPWDRKLVIIDKTGKIVSNR